MNAGALTSSRIRLIKAFNFTLYGSIAVYSTYFALYLKDLGWSTASIGTLLAGGPVVAIFANPFWGYWADRKYGNRRILILALTSAFVIMQAVFLSRQETFIYAAMLLFFLFQSPLFTQSNSLVLSFIEGTGRKFGAFRLWGSLGWAIVAAASGPVIGRLGIANLWIVFDAMMAVALAFAFLLPREEARIDRLEGPDAVRHESLSAGASAAPGRSAWLGRHFICLLALGVLVSVPNSFNTTFSGLYIQALGGSPQIVGWSIFATAILEAPVYMLLDRYLTGSTRTMTGLLAGICLLYAARWLLMGSVDDAMAIVWIQLMHCVTFGAYYYIGTQLTNRLTPPERRSTGQALYGLSWGGISGFIAGVAGGWLFGQYGAPAVYRAGALLTLAGAAGFLLLLRVTPEVKESRHGLDR